MVRALDNINNQILGFNAHTSLNELRSALERFKKKRNKII